jgi:hypothetical protein
MTIFHCKAGSWLSDVPRSNSLFTAPVTPAVGLGSGMLDLRSMELLLQFPDAQRQRLIHIMEIQAQTELENAKKNSMGSWHGIAASTLKTAAPTPVTTTPAPTAGIGVWGQAWKQQHPLLEVRNV